MASNSIVASPNFATLPQEGAIGPIPNDYITRALHRPCSAPQSDSRLGIVGGAMQGSKWRKRSWQLSYPRSFINVPDESNSAWRAELEGDIDAEDRRGHR